MDNKVTMKDIAERLNISINAVSIALNNKAGVSDEMRMKIFRTANEMGYIEKSPKFIRSFSLSNLIVMMQKIYSNDMNFYGKVLYSIVKEAKKSGFDTMINFFDDEHFVLPDCVIKRRVTGIIVIGKISDKNIVMLKQESGLPLVLVDHASLTNTIDCVLTDNKLGGYIVTKYLIDQGFQKIGFFGDLDYSLSIKERFFGFKEALSSCGSYQIFGNVDEYIKLYSITKNIEQAVLDNDKKKISQLIESAKVLPQAFVCSNDKAAIALLISLQSLNYRVPEDISLIGFDNIDMSETVSPKLTTVNVNKITMGKRALQRMQYLLHHRNSQPESTVMSVELIERESVKVLK